MPFCIGEGFIKKMDDGIFCGLLIMNGMDISPLEKEKLHNSQTVTAYANSCEEGYEYRFKTDFRRNILYQRDVK